MCARWMAVAIAWTALSLGSASTALLAQAPGAEASGGDGELPKLLNEEDGSTGFPEAPALPSVSEGEPTPAEGPAPETGESSGDAAPGEEELPPGNSSPVEGGGTAPQIDMGPDDFPALGPVPNTGPAQPPATTAGPRRSGTSGAATEPVNPYAEVSPEGTREEATENAAGSSAEEGAEEDAEEDAEIIPQEVVQERYENGRIRIERGVAQDERENYVNHGPWKMYDPEGAVVAEGSYEFGLRKGAWMRTYRPNEADMFAVAPFNLFHGPFVSEATFRDGKLHGHWIIRDASNQKVCDWKFVDGRRDGESTWYYHTGRPMRVIHYRQGQIHGELLEWDLEGKPATRVEYQDGRRLDTMTETYPDGQKKVEGMVLHARLVMKDPDNWWDAKLATYTRQGKDQKHGEWTAWYPNKQMKFTGSYQYDKPSGKFAWWHENSQKSLEGAYTAGKKSGPWTWWHANGQKAIQGEYAENSPSGRWIWWHESGKVAQRIDFTAAGATAVTTPGDGPRSILQRVPATP